MKNNYTSPTIQVIELNNNDIITTSFPNEDFVIGVENNISTDDFIQ